MVSAEMPSTSDQIIWTEHGRLHPRYAYVLPFGNQANLPAGAVAGAIAAGASGTALNFSIPTAQPRSTGITTDKTEPCNFRVGETVMVQIQTSATSAVGGTGEVIKGVVTEVSGQNFQIKCYVAHLGVLAAIESRWWQS